MLAMKRSIRAALWLALPGEIINSFCMPPLDVDFPSDAPWYAKAVALEWVILHLPGLWLTAWLSIFNSKFFLPILFACGYLTTAVLLFLLIRLVRAVLRLARWGSQRAADSKTGDPTPIA
jgi:hypothetical protein